MMKTLLAATALFFAVAESQGKEIQLSAGMSRAEAVKILQESADDLSLGLEVSAGPNGEARKEFCWELKDYDLVVWLYGAGDGTILRFGFWTKRDFKQPKWERYDQEQTARRITLDTEKHIVKVEKFPEYFPREVFDKYGQSGLAPVLFAANEPVLTTSEKEKGHLAIRVLYFSADRRPHAAVRYEAKGGRCYRRAVVLLGKTPGKAAESKEIEVPKQEIDNLKASLEKSGFWKMPKDDPIEALDQYPGQDNRGKDGSRVVIETIKEGEHRVRARWSPGYKSEDRGLSGLVRLYTGVFEETGLWKKSGK